MYDMHMCIFCTREEFNTVPWHKSKYRGVYKSNIKNIFVNYSFLRNLRKFFVLFSFSMSIFNFLSLYINTPHTHTPLGCLKKRTHTEILHTHTLNVQKKHYHIYAYTHVYTSSLSHSIHTQTHTHSTGYF